MDNWCFLSCRTTKRELRNAHTQKYCILCSFFCKNQKKVVNLQANLCKPLKTKQKHMEYNFTDIEQKWQKAWEEAEAYKVSNDSDKPHYYVLDMFPYPSGAGLHVGHPLGYIASDIYSRYKRQKGFNVLHPMGFDSYGLPAEQYAIQTGQHPEKTTFENIDRYISQLKKIGFCYD